MDEQSKVSKAKDVVTIIREILILVGLFVIAFFPKLLPQWAKHVSDAGKEEHAKSSEISFGMAKFLFDHDYEPAQLSLTRVATLKDELASRKQEIDVLRDNAQELVKTVSDRNVERAK